MDSFRVFHNIQRGLNMQIKTVTVNNTKTTSRSDSMTDESADFSASQSCCTEPDENEVTIKQDVRIG